MTEPVRSALTQELAALVGPEHVLTGETATRAYVSDGSVSRGVRGAADAVVLPGSAEQVARVLEWCYVHDVPLVPRGGGTGLAGGAVSQAGQVVCSLERLTRIRAFEPGRWRAHVEAGVTTATLHRLAREHGLFFPPDPGAAEQSQIGGNIATNAGGPHALKYGSTGAWVTGLEVAVAPGQLVSLGGPVTKDVGGYDLKSLLIGSEGTLGLITAAWLRLIPAPEATEQVVAFYPTVAAGCAGLDAVFAYGLRPAALDFVDGRTFAAAAAAYPGELPAEIGRAFGSAAGAYPAEVGRTFASAAGAHPGTPPAEVGLVLLVELDGSRADVERQLVELREALEPGSLLLDQPRPDDLWRWRDGLSGAAAAALGGKVSEDIAVPVERLGEAIEQVRAIAARHGLEGCSWGHAGDGILHATFLLDGDDPEQLASGELAAQELFELGVRLGGAVTGEHGIGLVKRGALARQWSPAAVALHEQVKRMFDPKGLLNPGKKAARDR
jgi:FAD/FMN-containing dehydrogenase